MATTSHDNEPTTDAALSARHSHALVAFEASIVGPSMATEAVHYDRRRAGQHWTMIW